MALDPDVFSELLSTLRRFVDETLIPAERQVSEEDRIPEDISRMMRDMGLFGLSIPEEYGGLGLTTEEEMRVIFEVTRASPAFRSSFGTNVGIGSQGIILDGTEEQKRRYPPRLASGELIASFA